MVNKNKSKQEIENETANAIKVISAAAAEAARVIASAATEATKVLTNTAIETSKTTNQKTSADHDLLIELRTEMGNIRKDIRELKDGTTQRIDILENDKADRKDLDLLQNKVSIDFENRLRILETQKTFYATSLVIYTAVGVFMIGLSIYHILQ